MPFPRSRGQRPAATVGSQPKPQPGSGGSGMAFARRSSGATGQRMRALSASMVLLASVTVAVFIQSEAQAAVPAGFTEVTAFSGLQNPTAIRFAADGRVFVAEKRGVIQMYDG